MNEKNELLSMMENVIFLKKYTIFSKLNVDELRTLALISKDIDVSDGDCVVKENDAGDSFFIIKRGVLRIVKGSGDNEIELALLEKNACFGEMALFEEEALRSASVFAKGNCKLLIIQKDDFFDAIAKHPGISIELNKIFTERIKEANQKLYKN